MNNNELEHFMCGLLYPAVLGSGLISLAIRITSHLTMPDPHFMARVSLGILFLSFFCASFVASNRGTYSQVAFLLDIVETGLMFLCFFFLGLFSQSNEAPALSYAYATFLILIPLQVAWRRGVNLDAFDWIELRILVFLALLIGLWQRYTHPYVTPLVAGFSLFIISIYVFRPNWYMRLKQLK